MSDYKIGQQIRIIHMDDNNGMDTQAYGYNDKVGIIDFIDGIDQLHGTWGGLTVNPDVDEIEIIS